MYDSHASDTESTDPTTNATTITAAVLDTVDHLQSEARGDQGASIGAVIETVLQHTEYEVRSVLDEVARLQTNGDIYVADGDGRRIKLTQVMADGGLDDETAARYVQGVLDAADAALTEDEQQKLGAVVEYLTGDEQTAADGGEN